MKNQFYVKFFAVLSIVAFTSSYVSAHTALSESTPKDGAMVMRAPEALQLSFTESVRLLKVTVKRGEAELGIGFSPVATAANQFSVALPVLENGSYTVNWTVMGADSHTVEGKLSFMVGMMGEHHDQHENPGHEAHDQHADHENPAQAGHDH